MICSENVSTHIACLETWILVRWAELLKHTNIVERKGPLEGQRHKLQNIITVYCKGVPYVSTNWIFLGVDRDQFFLQFPLGNNFFVRFANRIIWGVLFLHKPSEWQASGTSVWNIFLENSIHQQMQKHTISCVNTLNYIIIHIILPNMFRCISIILRGTLVFLFTTLHVTGYCDI
jgi:hypothetical protein